MLLAIDVGNTNTVFGIHDGETWITQWRSATDPTKTADDHAAWLLNLADSHESGPIRNPRLHHLHGCAAGPV